MSTATAGEFGRECDPTRRAEFEGARAGEQRGLSANAFHGRDAIGDVAGPIGQREDRRNPARTVDDVAKASNQREAGAFFGDLVGEVVLTHGDQIEVFAD